MAISQAEAALSLAKVNLARMENVVDRRAVSRQDYDAKKNAVEAGEAQVRQNHAAVENARLNLEYCTIRSPMCTRKRAMPTGQTRSARKRPDRPIAPLGSWPVIS